MLNLIMLFDFVFSCSLFVTRLNWWITCHGSIFTVSQFLALCYFCLLFVLLPLGGFIETAVYYAYIYAYLSKNKKK